MASVKQKIISIFNSEESALSPQRNLTDEEKDIINNFVRNCQVNVQQGRIILGINGCNEMNSKLEAMFIDTEKILKTVDHFLNNKRANCEIKNGIKIFSGVAAGAITGGTLGAPFCGLDMGLFAGLGAIIGGTVALTIVNPSGVTLGSLLLRIIDNMNEIQKNFAEIYGYEVQYVKKD